MRRDGRQPSTSATHAASRTACQTAATAIASFAINLRVSTIVRGLGIVRPSLLVRECCKAWTWSRDGSGLEPLR